MGFCKRNRKSSFLVFFLNILFALFIILSMLYIGGMGSINLTIQDNVFAKHMYINGIDVSGLTYEEAEAQLMQYVSEYCRKANITLVYKGNKTVLTYDKLGIIIDIPRALSEAYNYDKGPGFGKLARYDRIVRSKEDISFSTLSLDEQILCQTIKDYICSIEKPPRDAVAIVDKDNRKIDFTDSQDGIDIDEVTLTACVLQMIKEANFSELIVESVAVPPAATLTDLKKNTVLVAEYETKAGYNENRNKNISLMCHMINGISIQPGEVFSINATVGERTPEKGFMPAPIILGESGLADGIGGGICQVAGTLYNAALLANMEIVERVRHTYPTNYLPIGLDSTLNWDDKDLKIKNTTDMPIYIFASFENQTVKVQLYGKPLPENETIEIENQIVEVINYNTEIRYSTKLAPGKTQVLTSPRKGYRVNVYRRHLVDGEVVTTEPISKDVYPAVNKVILVGSNIIKD
ncbi:MAG TPA: VanW family protein [Clostridia bacterium]|nr:VanW family protein [Clostridia bacterium]